MIHLVQHRVVAFVDGAVVLLLHHGELDVDDGLFLGRDVLGHVLLAPSKHVGLQSPPQGLRLHTNRSIRVGKKKHKCAHGKKRKVVKSPVPLVLHLLPTDVL